LSVVIPTFNEEKNIPEALRRISAYLELKKCAWEALVLNDGSRDRTQDVFLKYVQEHPGQPVRVLRFDPNHGKGFAARQGMLAAKGRYVLLTDADMSAPIKEVDKLIAAIENGCDVAIGSRAVRAPGCDVRQSFKRWLSGRIFNIFVQSLALPGIYDSQCGFKCFSNEAAKKIFSAQKLNGFAFDVEALFLARRFGYKIAEVPVMWSEGKDSKINLLRDPFLMISDLLKIKRLHKNT
jgi:dolichyl-phosphate beta-glucosyltransferase